MKTFKRKPKTSVWHQKFLFLSPTRTVFESLAWKVQIGAMARWSLSPTWWPEDGIWLCLPEAWSMSRAPSGWVWFLHRNLGVAEESNMSPSALPLLEIGKLAWVDEPGNFLNHNSLNKYLKEFYHDRAQGWLWIFYAMLKKTRLHISWKKKPLTSQLFCPF